MKRTFMLVIAGAAFCAAAPLAAHGGHHSYRGWDSYDDARECGRWCLGSDWCRAQPVGHEHTDRCYYFYGPRDSMRDSAPPPMCDVPRAYPQAPQMPAGRPYGMMNGMGGGSGKVTFGTVMSVDKDASTITINDADGQSVVVHVSPFTALSIPPKAPADADSRVMGPPPRYSVGDIAAGSYVMVKAFDTETKTIEARNVIVKNAS